MTHQIKASATMVYDVTPGTQMSMQSKLHALFMAFVADVEKQLGEATAREMEVFSVADTREDEDDDA